MTAPTKQPSAEAMDLVARVCELTQQYAYHQAMLEGAALKIDALIAKARREALEDAANLASDLDWGDVGCQRVAEALRDLIEQEASDQPR